MIRRQHQIQRAPGYVNLMPLQIDWSVYLWFDLDKIATETDFAENCSNTLNNISKKNRKIQIWAKCFKLHKLKMATRNQILTNKSIVQHQTHLGIQVVNVWIDTIWR